MDQELLANELIDNGKKLVEALNATGFDVMIAFWARPIESGSWYLYLASTLVDEKGPAAGYRLVQQILRNSEDLWIDPLEIKVLGKNDSMADAAVSLVQPRISSGPFAVPSPRPYPGMTRFGGSSLGGIEVDGAYIYPQHVPAGTS